MDRVFKTAAKTLLFGTLFASVKFCCAQSVVAVPQLDLNRFTVTWYEIARLPSKRERHCILDPVKIVALGDKANRLQIVDSCKSNKGYTDIKNASAKLADKTGDGKLKVTYIYPFSRKQWVLAVGQSYEWILLGSPNHKELWIYSKTPGLGEETATDLSQKAASEGFDTAKLIRPAHSSR